MNFANARDAARQYIDLGFRPIPLYGVVGGACTCGSFECKPRDWGKHEPAETDGHWKEGREFSPDDFPDGSNIAIAMGPWGGNDDWLVALDWDGIECPGLASHIELLDPPVTLWQHTPRGVHQIFTVPAYTPLGNWVDCWQTKEEGYQMDLRYARGRVVVAPSLGFSGAYKWHEMREPVALPDDIIEKILDRRRERGLPVLSRWDRGSKRA